MKQHQFMTSLTEFLMGMFYSASFDDRSKGWKGWLEDEDLQNGDIQDCCKNYQNGKIQLCNLQYY
jgi:major membrane immunogen (membrane-anchored lipoprotein)